MQDWLKFHDLGQAFCYLVVVKHKRLSVPARLGLNILGFGILVIWCGNWIIPQTKDAGLEHTFSYFRFERASLLNELREQ